MTRDTATWLVSLLCAALSGCTAPPQPEPATTPVVTIVNDEPTVVAVGDKEITPSDKCEIETHILHQRRVTLRHPTLGGFAEVSGGHVTLRLHSQRADGQMLLEDGGWQLVGDVQLADVDIYAARPLWLDGCVYPNPWTPLRVVIEGGEMHLTGDIDLRPHRLAQKDNHFTVRETSFDCEDIHLSPHEYAYTPEEAAGETVSELPRHSIDSGTTLAIGPRDGDARARLTMRGRQHVRLVARVDARCCVLYGGRAASVLGWLRCDALEPARSGESTHRRRGPRVRMGTNRWKISLKCTREVPLCAVRTRAESRVG